LQHKRFCQCDAKNCDSYYDLNPNDLSHFLDPVPVSWRRLSKLEQVGSSKDPRCSN
jgi:hypothetical protein